MFYPSDPVSAEHAVLCAANTKGICFIRTSRPATVCVYKNDEAFAVGEHKVVKDGSDCLVIGAGVTLHEALKAAKNLEGEVSLKVVDLFTIKPLNVSWLVDQAKQCGGKIVVVEDHYPQGGIGSAVAEALMGESGMVIKHLAVQSIPRSGPSAALMEMFKIDAKAIEEAVKSF